MLSTPKNKRSGVEIRMPAVQPAEQQHERRYKAARKLDFSQFNVRRDDNNDTASQQ
jgi:hypothetical protein